MDEMEFAEYQELEESFDGDITLFWIMMKLGTPKMTDQIKRACVSFYPSGQIDMRINPEFWKKLSFYEKRFVFAHELLHVLYSHGTRMSNMGDRDKANIAADIIVNETLVDVFGFIREKVRFHNTLCWRDTVFGEKEKDVELKSFEHYYQRLINGEGNKKNTLDNHEGDEGVPGAFAQSNEIADRFKEAMVKEMSNLPKETIEKMQSELENALNNEGEDSNQDHESKEAGNGIGQAILNYKYKKNYYPYFKNVIDRWLDSFEFEKEEDQFIFREPFLELLSEKMLIPSAYDEDDLKFEKNELWVFIDASGSCGSFVSDFSKACSGIPDKYFNTSLFSFTTRVSPVEVKDGKINIVDALGGTSFGCIDRFIQSEITKEKVKPPHYIFVLTDGFAEKIKPRFPIPERWHFFITPSDFLRGNKSKGRVFDLAVPDGAKAHNFTDIMD